jgi:hypothetical protein
MIGGTPAAAAILVSPWPWVTLKSIWRMSVPITFTSAPPPRNKVSYALSRPRCCASNFSWNFSKFSGLTSLATVATMFGVAPFSKNFSLCVLAAWSPMISRTTGDSHDMPR